MSKLSSFSFRVENIDIYEEVTIMTVQELIESLEEVEYLNVVLITKNKCCEFYESEDIEFIDEETLNLEVKHYEFKTEKRGRRKCRMVDIEC